MATPKTTLCLLAAASLFAAAAHADTHITVVFDDPQALYGAYQADIERVTVAAGNTWLSNFTDSGLDTELTVRISFADMATASGNSSAAALLGADGSGRTLYEQGAAHELRTGIDSNGTAADIQINLGINGYLQNDLWFDPNPTLRLAPVPAGQVDAMSVMLHEFGHAFGFNGWRDGASGQLPGNYLSTFDALVQPQQTFAGTTLFFNGPRASALYGGAVPLTMGDYGHLGNDGDGPGSSLVPDLMNGVVFYRGTRYTISTLDLAMLQDMGLPVAVPVPEPVSALLWMAGLGLLAYRWRTSSSSRPSSRLTTP